MTAEMLVAYYGKGYDSKEIFDGLNISKDKDYLKYLKKIESCK